MSSILHKFYVYSNCGGWKMTFAERLKELRSEKRFTQRELATRLGFSANCICEWEKGRSEPSIDSLKALAVCLDCTVDYLIGVSDDFGNVVLDDYLLGQSLSTEEKSLVKELRALPEDLQRRASVYIKKLSDLNDLERTN